MKWIGKSVATVLVPAVLVVGLSGCGKQFTGDPVTSDQNTAKSDSDIVSNSYQAAERLISTSHQPISRDKPVLVASLVSVSNLDRSSNFGRIVSEQISSRLTQLGYQMREMRFRSSFLVQSGTGELVLSRRLKDISRQQDAQAVITGVYAVARTSVYVTLRLIRAVDGQVISAYDYVLPIGPDTASLLAAGDISAN
jgi:TolB-like protein